jgi:disease resistance protein RPM1
MPKVRSYTAFMYSIDSWDQFLRFKRLIVLDLVDCSFKKGCHLEHLGDLLHLRYLGITGKDSEDLEPPKQIGNLKLLQTLAVYGPLLLPASIVHLTQLLRLCAKYKVPDGIGKLVYLEELRILNGWSDKHKRFLKELGSLRELRVLKFSTDVVVDESMKRDFAESLCNLQKIQHIEVYGYVSEADTAMWETTSSQPVPLVTMCDYYG